MCRSPSLPVAVIVPWWRWTMRLADHVAQAGSCVVLGAARGGTGQRGNVSAFLQRLESGPA